MRYYLDTEFLEGPQDKKLFGFKYGQTKPTIDLISIGMVAEDQRSYYAVSKDFNLKQAWGDEWIRDNVLLPIYAEHIQGDLRNKIDFDYQAMQVILDQYGKTNKQIAQEIKEFCTGDPLSIEKAKHYNVQHNAPEFWAYYADYDWVVFCQLFGRMIDLPKGFPMYCRDLKQLMDEKAEAIPTAYNVDLGLKSIKMFENYPEQKNEHNALADARWNRELHNFLINL